MILRPVTYWAIVVGTATLVLAAGSLAASHGLRSGSVSPTAATGFTQRLDRKSGHRVFNSRSGRAVLSVDGAVPGQQGRRRVLLANAGSRPFRRVMLTQDKVVAGGFSRALQLQVYDAGAQRCLYPRPPRHRQVPKVTVERRSCSRWMPFDGGRALRSLVVPGIDGTSTWRRGERHEIDIRWRLASSSPNSDQGRRASFRLRWLTSG